VRFVERVPAGFVRGDANQDGHCDVADAVAIVTWMFRGADAPSCADAADVTDDGVINLTDVTAIVAHRFLGGAPPPAPYPDCDDDPTGTDNLDCEVEGVCPW